MMVRHRLGAPWSSVVTVLLRLLGRDAVHQRALALDDADLTRWIAGRRVRVN